MNLFKKLASAALVLTLLVSFAGCHPANEVAMTIGGVDISSGMYMCFLIQADSEGRDAVDAAVSETASDASSSSASSSSASSTTNYYKETLEETDFTEWVRNRAREAAVEYATYIKLYNERGLTLSEEDLSTIDTYCNYYWNTYGYSSLYGSNGVSFDTYKEYFSYSYKTRTYFLSVYGADGTNPVAQDEVNDAISKNFAAVDVLQLSYTHTENDETVDYSEEEIAAIKAKAQTYSERLKNGESFETIYLEENPSTDESSAETDEDADYDKYATIFVSEAAQPYASSQYYSYDYWDEASSLAVGDSIVIDDDENKYSLVLYKAQNVLDSTQYIETFTDPALYILKQEEMESSIKTESEGLEVSVNDYAVNRFKPKNISYPSTTA